MMCQFLVSQWQRAQQKMLSREASTQEHSNVLLRPSDIFYAKLVPALREKEITNVMARSEWPMDVKHQVFLELVAETPKYLSHFKLLKSQVTACTISLV